MRRQAAAKIDQGIGKQEAPPEETQEAKHPTMTTFRVDPGKRRKPGTGCVTQIDDHLWEGQYSPRGPDGKQRSRNVYGHTQEECEEKLKVLIETMKTEIQAERDSSGKQGRGHESEKKKLPRMREFSCLWYFCGQSKTAKNQGTANARKSCKKQRKEPDFKGNQVLFGGDYWTRTSDLLRVKIRLDVKGLILGAFRCFWLRFFETDRRSLSTVSIY